MNDQRKKVSDPNSQSWVRLGGSGFGRFKNINELWLQGD